MLTVDLGRLAREGSVDVEATLSADDGFWESTGLAWSRAPVVRLRATEAGTGEVVVRGQVEGTLQQECRRCLEPVNPVLKKDLTLVFVEEPDEDDDGGVYGFEPTGAELDLSDAVREEVLLAVNPYVECRPDCRGLCPLCGTNLNEESCDCTEQDADPRWEALRRLESE